MPGVVRHRREAHRPRDGGLHAVAGGEAGALEQQRLVAVVAVRLAQLGARAVVLLDPARVGHLAAAGRIERRLAQLREEEPVLQLLERADLRQRLRLLVADELGAEPGRGRELGRALRAPARHTGARDLAVVLHQPRVLLVVDAEAALARELHRQLDRKAVRRCERERVVAGDLPARRRLVEQLHAALERLAEPLLLGGEHLPDLAAVLDELRIRLPHLLDHRVREPREERRLHADAQPVLRGAADDPAQDVAAALVRRRHALGDDERHAAAVVGEHAVRLRRVGRLAVRETGLRGDPLHDQLVAVGVVDRRDVLDDARGALQAETRVDVLLRQVRERAVGVQLVRHEDEVPELEEALAARAAGLAVRLAAAGGLAPVVVDLRVGAARARAADRPEVLRRRQRHDPLRRHADLLPEVDRHLVGAELQLGVAGVDGDPDPVPVELQPVADELGRVRDRALLEVLPEREVAEHLEEGQVVRVEPDLVDVDGAEALLRERRRRRGRLLAAEEERHLRLHARGDEQRRAVVGARDQRRRRAAQVALLLEEGEIALADLGRCAHRRAL